MDPAGADIDVLRRRAKRQLRDRARALRAAIPAGARETRSTRIVERVVDLAEARAALSVALFWPMAERGEVDLRTLDAHLRADHKRIFYPRMAGSGGVARAFALVDDPGALAARGRGFFEPPEGAPEAASGDLQLVVVPALAVTITGDRLGYGAGFYDTILPRFCPPAISVVVAFDFELLPELPVTPNDVACDIVVTDVRTIRVSAQKPT